MRESRTWKALLPFAALAFWIFGIVAMLPRTAAADMIELSTGVSFTRTDYGLGNYDWVRRWGASFGYYFFAMSEVELAFQDIVDRTYMAGFQDTTFHDQIYSLDWVQSFFPRTSFFQPYVKLGIGQLNRDASGTYGNGTSPPLIYDSVTGVLGAGVRLFLTKQFALRAEGTTYLIGGDIQTWQDNFSINVGVSIYL